MEDAQYVDARNHRMLQQRGAALAAHLTHAWILVGLNPDQRAVAAQNISLL